MFILYILIICNLLQNMNGLEINNVNYPECKNCKYYKPDSLFDYRSSLNKCKYFGKKDIISGKILYDYADLSRKDENKCGIEGKCFEEDDDDVDLKIILFKLTNFSPYLFIMLFWSYYLSYL